MKNGFTLIEVVVTTAVLIVTMLTVGVVLSNTLRSSTQIETTNTLENVASQTMAEIKKNILSSSRQGVICTAGYSNQVLLTSVSNQLVTTLICNGSIASVSAATANLTPNTVTATNCDHFISCDLGSDGLPTAVNVGFTLQIGNQADVENSYQRSFVQKVTLRQ